MLPVELEVTIVMSFFRNAAKLCYRVVVMNLKKRLMESAGNEFEAHGSVDLTILLS